MQEKSLESLSAMMDSEVQEFELRRVVELTTEDQELKDKWLRYHLAQDVMKGQSVHVASGIDLVGRVSAALESEPNYSASPIKTSEQQVSNVQPLKANSQWWKPAASMAVAASVTAVVLMVSGQFSTPSVTGPIVDLASVPKANAGFPQSRFGNELSTVSAAAVKTPSAETAFGMKQYIQQHIDLSYPKAASWQANWLPAGYDQVKHNVSSAAEVLLFTNGTATLSINIEKLGTQMVSQGVVSSNELIALGVRAKESFITVIGAVSLQEASKIAASIGPVGK